MEHGRHVLRVLFVLVVCFSAVVIARQFLVPPSFGAFGPYRAANVVEQRAHPVLHQGAESCRPCHAKQWDAREEGEAHAKVGCESCHGPGARHATAEARIAPMPVDRSVKLCARCHRRLEGRPAGFPQISLDDPKHFKGHKLEDGVCRKCHEPHSTMFEEA